MKKNLIAIIVGILFSITEIIAQTQVNDNTEYNSVLWEISGNNLAKSSYLFGTIHLIPESDYTFSNILKEKFDSCKMLVLEADIDMPLKQQIELVKKMIYPKGKRLNDYMSMEQFAKFQSYMLDTLKLEKGTFNKIKKIKPIFASALVISDLIEKPLSYETEFSKEAKKRKMGIIGLETLEFQMSLFDSISVERQVEMLLKSGFDSNPLMEYNKLLAAYKQQDLEKLYNFAKDDDDFKYFEEDLFTNRNNKWVASLKKIMEAQSSFIAVGVAHLYGEKGMISLLRKEGYTVKAIK
jgi:uncharacterized protein YbaP (TraB family)